MQFNCPNCQSMWGRVFPRLPENGDIWTSVYTLKCPDCGWFRWEAG